MSIISLKTEELLTLFSIPRVGVVSVRNIAINYEPYILKTDYLIEKRLIPAINYQQLLEANVKATLIIDSCSDLGISIVSIVDSSYPPLLKKIKDAPPILYIKGSLESLHSPCAAIVGTRKASEPGLKIAGKVAQELAINNFTIVSGLALGIDTAAHRGALRDSGKTIAILAHGLHTIAPSSNKKLAEEILEKGGALVSEHPPGTPARPPEFVRRNRIQSGMSEFSVIVETGEVGGTIYQAQFTREQGKTPYVIIPPDEIIYNGFNSTGGIMIATKMGGVKISSVKELLSFVCDKPEVSVENADTSRSGFDI